MSKRSPGQVRDAILSVLKYSGGEAPVSVIVKGVEAELGPVASSSVRSYLRLNAYSIFERRSRGLYAVRSDSAYMMPLPLDGERAAPATLPGQIEPFTFGSQTLYLADCIDWLGKAEPNSVHAVVTDPPYGLVEYNAEHQRKMREGKGGRWRLPPSFDGAHRMPLPRFTVLSTDERAAVVTFFTSWGKALLRVLRPGGHLVIAGNPLVAPLV